MVEQDATGNWFSTNAVTAIYEDMDGQHQVLFMDPQGLFDTVYKGIKQMAQVDESVDEKLPSDLRATKTALVKGMRIAVKGVLIMWGEKMLTMFYGTKDHPHPPKDKNLDLVDWYMHQFTAIAIAHMMRHDLVLKGQHTEVGSNVLSISSVGTRPIPAPSKVEGTAPTRSIGPTSNEGGE